MRRLFIFLCLFGVGVLLLLVLRAARGRASEMDEPEREPYTEPEPVQEPEPVVDSEPELVVESEPEPYAEPEPVAEAPEPSEPPQPASTPTTAKPTIKIPSVAFVAHRETKSTRPEFEARIHPLIGNERRRFKRRTRIELASLAWKAKALPLSYRRVPQAE